MSPFFQFEEKRCDNLTAESPSAALKAIFRGKCSIGSFSYAGPGSKFNNTIIGRYCSIAANVTVGPTQHPTDRFTTHLLSFGSVGPFKGSDEFHRVYQKRPHERNKGETKIGNDVWIGANVTVMRGVSVADGAIIGAGSVVTKDVAAYSIVGGSPAKLIRMRFDKDIMAKLHCLKWWDYDLNDAEIAKIDFSDIHAFIHEFGALVKAQKLNKLEPIVRIVKLEKKPNKGASNAHGK